MRVLAGLLVAVLPAFCQAVTPFTVTEISRTIGMSGQSVKESRFLFAMNRDGSIVSVDLDPSSGGARQIIDAVKHRTIVVNPNARSAAITPYGWQPQFGSPDACEQRFRHIVSPAPGCPSTPCWVGAVVSVVRSAGAIQGILLQRISVTEANGLSMAILVAPSLACHMMEVHTFRNGLLLMP